MREWLIFPSLAAASLALMTFHSAWWGLVLLYLSIRVYCLRDGRIFYSYVIILVLVVISAYCQRPRLAPAVTDNQASFTVRMPINQLSVDGDQVAFKGQVVDSDHLQKYVQCYYRLGSESEKADWLALDESVVLEVEGHLELPKENRNRQLFNYRRYLKQKNIYYILVIDTVTIFGPDQSLSGRWAQGVYRFINKFSDMTPTLVRDYSLSLFFNQSDAISQPVYQAYQKLGLIHLFAISGFHVNFLLKQMKNIFLRLGLSVEAFDYLALAFLLVYTAALAFPHGLLRASGAYLYNSWQIRHNREPSTFVGTAGVMLATLFLKPSAVLSLSFQLSYLLAFTIILMGRALAKWQGAFWLRGLLLNFLCSLLIMPILMINFHEFSWLNLLLNGLYSFIFANFLFPGLLLAMGLHLLDWQLVSRPLLWVLNWLIQGVENFSLWAQSWSFFHWITGQPPLYLLAILLTSILCFCLALEGRRYIKIASLFLTLSLLLVYISPYLNPWGIVQMIDIGQGDCLLVS
ncbi:ComEC/Rec2 family competence protein [Aerococcus kribbianus]|uniref:ComEC/Rec2 family competence protein n=1 Tax=Aerococcus kribbianus TaxID=2999064 RepID=A0A9X3FPC2_9LACT|nr:MULTISPECIES: ComEC/Rec2 family competence protein [unclassified Aerococcus]MCZ0717223.1 ComEC/Rec2 family competence protein [Aerococcus sp. YH-aer221]MCZ0725511.1 ComEC/Rec2 family competence protein [Aerococcus sp. YH-aer222]